MRPGHRKGNRSERSVKGAWICDRGLLTHGLSQCQNLGRKQNAGHHDHHEAADNRQPRPFAPLHTPRPSEGTSRTCRPVSNGLEPTQ
jgi:hypothetical protein